MQYSQCIQNVFLYLVFLTNWTLFSWNVCIVCFHGLPSVVGFRMNDATRDDGSESNDHSETDTIILVSNIASNVEEKESYGETLGGINLKYSSNSAYIEGYEFNGDFGERYP